MVFVFSLPLSFFISFLLFLPAHAQPWGDLKESAAEDFWQMHTPPDTMGGPKKGKKAPAIILKDLSGQTVNLKDYIGTKPIVLEFGSYTCPIFRGKHAGMERIYTKYQDKVHFFLIYTIEAHPKGDHSPGTNREWVSEPNYEEGILFRQPQTEEDRMKMAEIAKENLDIQLPILLDNMQNTTWREFGHAPNAAYLIGLDGRIKLRQGWFNPKELEKVLERELKK